VPLQEEGRHGGRDVARPYAYAYACACEVNAR
jgi:hypothetical protein